MPPRPLRVLALLSPTAALLPTGGCLAPRSSVEGPLPGVVDASREEEQRSDLEAQAAELIARGRFEDARLLLDDLLLEEALQAARAGLSAGSPEDALLHVDRALTFAPDDPDVLLLKADSSLELAEKAIASGGSAGLIEGALADALEYYGRAGESAHALYGASRAAWLLSDVPRALELARRGLERMRLTGSARPRLALLPERIHAEAACAAHAAARAAESPEAPALFRESEDALMRQLGRATGDAWAWARLADLYEREGSLAEAQSVLERGLELLPEETGLLERLSRVTRAHQGVRAELELFEGYVSSHPDLAAGQRLLGLAAVELGIEGLQADPRVLEPAAFTRGEQAFQRARELDPALAQEARGFELICRLGRGWCALHTGDLVAAEREFLSMDELQERGIEWSYPGRLESGIQGLARVVDAHHAREDWAAAGEVAERLHHLQPDVARWANNAGFLQREVGYYLELEGERLCAGARAAAGAPGAPQTAGERARLARAADECFERARAHMERSWLAYRRAAELAPEDVRIVNDAALVLVYYLQRDLDLAESYLKRCVELGEAQMRALEAELSSADPAGPERVALETRREALREAWGDAHQNLGVLYCALRGDGPGALPWLERSLEIGPDRPDVVNSLLPLARGLRVLEEDDPLRNWARPCQVR
jgi:tetratricopeptide (TPR) repeat protein